MNILQQYSLSVGIKPTNTWLKPSALPIELIRLNIIVSKIISISFINCYEANVATTTFTDTFGQWECKLLNTSHCLIMIKT